AISKVGAMIFFTVGRAIVCKRCVSRKRRKSLRLSKSQPGIAIAQPPKSASSSQDRHLWTHGSKSGNPACCSNASGSSKNTNWPTSSSFCPKRQQKHSAHATFLSRNYFFSHT